MALVLAIEHLEVSVSHSAEDEMVYTVYNLLTWLAMFDTSNQQVFKGKPRLKPYRWVMGHERKVPCCG